MHHSHQPQYPINANKLVVITVYDNRLIEEASKQTEFAIPVTCPTYFTYFKNVYIPVKEFSHQIQLTTSARSKHIVTMCMNRQTDEEES